GTGWSRGTRWNRSASSRASAWGGFWLTEREKRVGAERGKAMRFTAGPPATVAGGGVRVATSAATEEARVDAPWRWRFSLAASTASSGGASQSSSFPSVSLPAPAAAARAGGGLSL